MFQNHVPPGFFKSAIGGVLELVEVLRSNVLNNSAFQTMIEDAQKEHFKARNCVIGDSVTRVTGFVRNVGGQPLGLEDAAWWCLGSAAARSEL
jgi:hypothetical protein